MKLVCLCFLSCELESSKDAGVCVCVDVVQRVWDCVSTVPAGRSPVFFLLCYLSSFVFDTFIKNTYSTWNSVITSAHFTSFQLLTPENSWCESWTTSAKQLWLEMWALDGNMSEYICNPEHQSGLMLWTDTIFISDGAASCLGVLRNVPEQLFAVVSRCLQLSATSCTCLALFAGFYCPLQLSASSCKQVPYSAAVCY